MAQTLQINIDNHRYQLVNSIADGVYLVEINSQRRLMILLSVLLFLLSGYLLLSLTDFKFNPQGIGIDFTEVYRTLSAEPQAPVVREKHIILDTEISTDSYQHSVYLYYDRFNVLETFLPAQSDEQQLHSEHLSKF